MKFDCRNQVWEAENKVDQDQAHFDETVTAYRNKISTESDILVRIENSIRNITAEANSLDPTNALRYNELQKYLNELDTIENNIVNFDQKTLKRTLSKYINKKKISGLYLVVQRAQDIKNKYCNFRS